MRAWSSASSNGFATKSSAPSVKLSTFSVVVPVLQIMNGSSGASVFRLVQKTRPSTSGNVRSSTIRSGWPCLSIARASAPVSACHTV